jgi:hypothetical protein
MNYPRVSNYAAVKGNGEPLLLPPTDPKQTVADLKINVPLVTALSRYPVITLDATPWVAPEGIHRTDVLLLLRKSNPTIRIGMYVVGGWFWGDPTWAVKPVGQRTFADSQHAALVETGGYNPLKPNDVRWDNPPTEARLTSLICSAMSTRLWDFLFVDFMSANNTNELAALQRMVAAVHALGFQVIANGWSADALNVDGSMREGFPDTLGHDFAHVQNWRAANPHRSMDWLQAGTGLTSLDSADAQRQARFALGTACLFDCMASVGPDRDLKVTPYYGTWTLPEYEPAGWLGEPWGPARQVGGVYVREFAGGSVTVDPAKKDATFFRSR